MLRNDDEALRNALIPEIFCREGKKGRAGRWER
jgi:hypothetical protein